LLVSFRARREAKSAIFPLTLWLSFLK
jgi:hypothetical protein